jgi:hypothetical protein
VPLVCHPLLSEGKALIVVFNSCESAANIRRGSTRRCIGAFLSVSDGPPQPILPVLFVPMPPREDWAENCQTMSQAIAVAAYLL